MGKRGKGRWRASGTGEMRGRDGDLRGARQGMARGEDGQRGRTEDWAEETELGERRDSAGTEGWRGNARAMWRAGGEGRSDCWPPAGRQALDRRARDTRGGEPSRCRSSERNAKWVRDGTAARDGWGRWESRSDGGRRQGAATAGRGERQGRGGARTRRGKDAAGQGRRARTRPGMNAAGQGRGRAGQGRGGHGHGWVRTRLGMDAAWQCVVGRKWRLGRDGGVAKDGGLAGDGGWAGAAGVGKDGGLARRGWAGMAGWQEGRLGRGRRARPRTGECSWRPGWDWGVALGGARMTGVDRPIEGGAKNPALVGVPGTQSVPVMLRWTGCGWRRDLRGASGRTSCGWTASEPVG